MVRELLIFRHGQAQAPVPEHDEGGDLDWQLTDTGKRDAQRVGVWLAGNNRLPDYVVSSMAVRAAQTAEKCCQAGGLAAAVVQPDSRFYGASLDDLLDLLPPARRPFC